MKTNKLAAVLGGLLLSCNMSALAQVEVTMEFVSEFGEFGFYQPAFPANSVPPTGFSAPTGVAFLTSQRLIIADRGNGKLQSCDISGEDCTWIGNDGSGTGRNSAGTFDLPHGVAVTADGKIAVADEDNHWVQLCQTTGTCKFRGASGSEDALPSSSLGQWAFPQDVGVDSQGLIYGLDTDNNRIQFMDPDTMNFLGIFMAAGSAPGQLNKARGMAVDVNDQFIISDTGNHRIQICDDDANCTAFGSQGSAVGQFSSPVGVDVDALGRIWVADTGNNRIQVCNYSGDCQAFGSMGSGPFQFMAPHDVAVHPSGIVAVVDTENVRIQLFSTEASFSINPGLNDAWFNPATSGQGFFFTVYPGIKKMFLANFTFDTERPAESVTAILGEPGHRWLTAIGDYAGSSVTVDVNLTAGGVFNSETPVVSNTPYGTMEVEFLSCDSARVTYDLPDAAQKGTITLQRIVKDNVALCEALSAQ